MLAANWTQSLAKAINSLMNSSASFVFGSYVRYCCIAIIKESFDSVSLDFSVSTVDSPIAFVGLSIIVPSTWDISSSVLRITSFLSSSAAMSMRNAATLSLIDDGSTSSVANSKSLVLLASV